MPGRPPPNPTLIGVVSRTAPALLTRAPCVPPKPSHTTIHSVPFHATDGAVSVMVSAVETAIPVGSRTVPAELTRTPKMFAPLLAMRASDHTARYTPLP